MAGKHVGGANYVTDLSHPCPSPYRKENRAYADGANGLAAPSDAVGAAAHALGAANGGEEAGTAVYNQVAGNFGAAVAQLTGISVADRDTCSLMFWIKNDGTDWTTVGTRRFFGWGDGTTGTNECLTIQHLSTVPGSDGIYGLFTNTGFTITDIVNQGLTGGQTGANWQHVCLTRGPTNTRLYINAVEVDIDLSFAGNIGSAASDTMVIGQRHNQTAPALSDAIIADLWVGFSTPTVATLQAIYNGGSPANPGTDGQQGAYDGDFLGTPLVFMGGPGYDWTATPLPNAGTLGNFTVVTGAVTQEAGAG